MYLLGSELTPRCKAEIWLGREYPPACTGLVAAEEIEEEKEDEDDRYAA